MKQDTVREIQVAANIAILVVAVLLCVVIIKNYIIVEAPFSNATLAQTDSQNGKGNVTKPPAPARIQPGTKLTLTGIDWTRNGQTLVLAVSSKCRFCTESAPFYQRLVKEHGKTRLVAVMPQGVDEGKSYLDTLKVTVHEVKQVPLMSVGIRSTPTLLLVDANGVLTNSWVGKLSENQEAQVLNTLAPPGATN